MTTTSTSRRSSSSNRAAGAVGGTRDVRRANGSIVRVRWSTRSDGDFHRGEVPFDELVRRRTAFVPLPWTMLDEHHGTTAVHVERPGDHDGAPGDIAITRVDGAVLGCWVGDCAPVVLIGEHREVAVVHAGWRGLAAGVIDTAFDACHDRIVAALLGPSIGPCCYEFGADDLARVASGVGVRADAISAKTARGTLALDVPAAVSAACRRRDVEPLVLAGCTGCSFDGFSHRVRNDRGRHVVAVWNVSDLR